MKKRYLIISCASLLLFLLFLIMLYTVDVKNIGAGVTKVGLCFINNHSFMASNASMWDKISDVCMYLGIGVIGALFILGVVQLIQRKNILKVDKEILVFGCLVVLMIIIWLFFDKVLIVNNRPILVDGKVECSFPSTHIMITSFALLSGSYYLFKKINKKHLTIIMYVASAIIVTICFLGRVLSGMHFLTDAVCGLLMGLFLFFSLLAILQFIIKDHKAMNN